MTIDAMTERLPGNLLDDILALRHTLHRCPELPNAEAATAQRIADYLRGTGLTVTTGVGGHGVVAVLETNRPGPEILVRCELDALPIQEPPTLGPHASQTPGVSHKCGHDGHMAMVAGLAGLLASQPPPCGRITLVYQPAEETGQGALRMLASPPLVGRSFAASLALHNLPGFPLGSLVIGEGGFAAASCALDILLTGVTAHAGEPEKGLSPALAMCHLVQLLEHLPHTSAPFAHRARVTVVHARLGHVSLGTSPGEARVIATLRADTDDLLEALLSRAETRATALAKALGLHVTTSRREPFPATYNDAGLARLARDVAQGLGLNHTLPPGPFPWSEDFGHFARKGASLLVGLGAGDAHPVLHSPDYDFPDALLPVGVRFLHTLVLRYAGQHGGLTGA